MEPFNKKLAGIIRRCLTSKYIIRSRNHQMFGSLASYHEALDQYFSKMGAKLIINEDLGIAYLEPDSEIEEEMEYKLGRTITLGPLETNLLLFLRQKRMEYYSGDIESEVPWISVEKIREFLAEFSIEKEDKKFQAQFNRTLDHFKKYQILLPTANEDSMEISPVCDIVLPADEISAMKERAVEYFSKQEEGH